MRNVVVATGNPKDVISQLRHTFSWKPKPMRVEKTENLQTRVTHLGQSLDKNHISLMMFMPLPLQQSKFQTQPR